MAGPLSTNLCREGVYSALTDLLLSDNQLTGTLNLSYCSNLFIVDVSVSVRACHPGGACMQYLGTCAGSAAAAAFNLSLDAPYAP